jgi:hypothetical protein
MQLENLFSRSSKRRRELLTAAVLAKLKYKSENSFQS